MSRRNYARCTDLFTVSWMADRGVAITALAVSDDGECIAAAGSDGTAFVYRKTNCRWGVSPLLLEGHTEAVTCVGFKPKQQRFVATGSRDTTIRVWCCSTGSCLQIMSPHTQRVSGIHWLLHCPAPPFQHGVVMSPLVASATNRSMNMILSTSWDM